jgi:hypothetical protein
LAERLREERVLKRGADARLELLQSDETASVDLEDVDAFYDEAPAEEVEDTEDEVVDRASAARTIAELEAEIQTLRGLEGLAQQVRSSGTDQKWEQLSRLLQGDSEASAAGSCSTLKDISANSSSSPSIGIRSIIWRIESER